MFVGLFGDWRKRHRDRILLDREPGSVANQVGLKVRQGYAKGDWASTIPIVLEASVPSARTLLDWGVVTTEVSGALLDRQAFVPIEAGNTLRELMVRVFAAGATRSFILYHGGIYYTAALTLQAGEHREQALLYFRRFTKALFFLEELIANSEGDVLLVAAMGSPLCLLSGRLHKKKCWSEIGIPMPTALPGFPPTILCRISFSIICFESTFQTYVSMLSFK